MTSFISTLTPIQDLYLILYKVRHKGMEERPREREREKGGRRGKEKEEGGERRRGRDRQ